MREPERQKMFYSNCAIEAIKHKIADPHNIKITVVRKSEANCPHFMWSDGVNDYDFGVEKRLKWWQIFWFKGSVRKRNLGFNQKYKNRMNERRKAKRDQS